MKKSNTVNLLTILFLTVFPLIFDDHYFNITITKYYTFAVLCLAIFFAALYYKMTSVDLKKKITLSKTDIIMLLFLGSSTISCLLSEWKYASFTGSSGKHIGLLFLLLCGMLYYGITRYMTITRPILYSFPAILILCSVMSLFQFCGYDVLDFYKDMAAGTSVMYIATFGHVDVFSAFLSVYLPVCMYLFCHTSAKNEQVLYGAGCFFGILGVFCANSDSAYLGLATALAVLLVFALSDRAALLSYSFLLWIYCCAAALFQLLPMLSADMRTPVRSDCNDDGYASHAVRPDFCRYPVLSLPLFPCQRDEPARIFKVCLHDCMHSDSACPAIPVRVFQLFRYPDGTWEPGRISPL